MINEVQEKFSQSPRKKSLYMIYNIQSKSWFILQVLFSVYITTFYSFLLFRGESQMKFGHISRAILFSVTCLYENNKSFIFNIYFLGSFLLYIYHTWMVLDILPPLDGRIGPAEVVFDQKSMVAPLGLRLEPDNLGVSFFYVNCVFWTHY